MDGVVLNLLLFFPSHPSHLLALLLPLPLTDHPDPGISCMDPSAAFEAEEAIQSPKLNNQNEGPSSEIILEATSSSIPRRSISKSNSTSSSKSRSPNIFPVSPIHTDPPSLNLDPHRERDGDREATFAPSHRLDQPQPWTQPEHSVVRNRQGSVLTRGLVLKTDHFAGSGE